MRPTPVSNCIFTDWESSNPITCEWAITEFTMVSEAVMTAAFTATVKTWPISTPGKPVSTATGSAPSAKVTTASIDCDRASAATGTASPEVVTITARQKTAERRTTRKIRVRGTVIFKRIYVTVRLTGSRVPGQSAGSKCRVKSAGSRVEGETAGRIRVGGDTKFLITF